MSAKQCCGANPTCDVGSSIYTGKTDTGKGDKPRKVTEKYDENYTEIFPNAFKPKWQVELEKGQSKKKSKK